MPVPSLERILTQVREQGPGSACRDALHRAERALAGARWIAKAAEFHGLRRHVLFRTP